MNINNGGPAFPSIMEAKPHPHQMQNTGMTLRDWFAGQALASLIANQSLMGRTPQSVTTWANEIADAMIAAREAAQ